jgi:glycosyltransferase involved in cell wall biosynthesis
MAAKAPRLLFFVTEDWYFCSHRLPIAIAAKQAGFDVWVLTREMAHGDVIRNAGLKLFHIALTRGGHNPLGELAVLARAVRAYRQIRPDIAHHVAMKPVIYGSIAARLNGVGGVVNALGGLGYMFTSKDAVARLLRPLAEFWLRIGLQRKASVTLLQNPDDLDLLCTHGIVRREDVRLIPGSGVDTHRFQPVPPPSGAVTVVLAARMLRDKGVVEFVEAARQLGGNSAKVRFVLVGDPDPSNPASLSEQQLRDWVTQDIVEWWGWREDMAKVYQSAHIACLPSYREGFPKSLQEAAACGLPIVTTDVPGCREVIRDGRNGILVPSRDAAALAQALESLIANSALRASMGQASREIAEETFSITNIVALTLETYRHLLPAGQALPENPSP